MRGARHAFLRDFVAPRLLDYSMTRPWPSAYRARLLAQARGAVLEIGFGSGVNLPYYPREATSLTVLEPDPAMLALARNRIAGFDGPMRVVEGVGEAIPEPDQSFDTPSRSARWPIRGACSPRSAACFAPAANSSSLSTAWPTNPESPAGSSACRPSSRACA